MSRRSVLRDDGIFAELPVDGDAADPHRVTVREPECSKRGGACKARAVFAIRHVDVEHLGPDADAIRPGPFGAEARDPAPTPILEFHLVESGDEDDGGCECARPGRLCMDGPAAT